MEKVTFVLRDGKERLMKKRLAYHLQKAGKGHIRGTYITRDMQSTPVQSVIADGEHATSAAKRLADEKGVDVASLEGTGKGGAVTVGDVKKATKDAE